MKLKNFLLLAIFMIAPIMIFAQNVPVETITAETPFWKISLEFGIYTLGSTLVLAINHIVAGTFKLSAWWADSAKPLAFSLAAGIALIALDKYLPSVDAFIERFTGPTDFTNFGTMATASLVLVAFIKGLLKINKTKEKVAKLA